MKSTWIAGALIVCLGGCASVTHLTDYKYKPRVAERDIPILTMRPQEPFEELAVIKTEDMFNSLGITQLRAEAFKLGADAVVITGHMARFESLDVVVGTAIRYRRKTRKVPSTRSSPALLTSDALDSESDKKFPFIASFSCGNGPVSEGTTVKVIKAGPDGNGALIKTRDGAKHSVSNDCLTSL